MTRPDVEWRFALTARWGDGQCGRAKLEGYDVRVTKSGRAAGDYELIGIAGLVDVGGEDIARGSSDDWLRFFAHNPGGAGNERVGVIWRRAPDPSPVVVALPLPPDPAPREPAPAADRGRDRWPVCDPVPPAVTFGAAINSDRAIHIALGHPYDAAPGTVVLAASLERDPQQKVTSEPTFTPDFGYIYGAPYSYSPDDHLAVVTLDARCDDGRILPRRITLRVAWPVEQATRPARLEASVVLELQPDGSFTSPT